MLFVTVFESTCWFHANENFNNTKRKIFLISFGGNRRNRSFQILSPNIQITNRISCSKFPFSTSVNSNITLFVWLRLNVNRVFQTVETKKKLRIEFGYDTVRCLVFRTPTDNVKVLATVNRRRTWHLWVLRECRFRSLLAQSLPMEILMVFIQSLEVRGTLQ